MRRIGKFLSRPYVADSLNVADARPTRILESLPQDFWQRHEKRLLHGDFQAKNVLADDTRITGLIDFDFGRGHPLFDVAQFLTQLIRLHRRWNMPHVSRILEDYGEALLAAYFDAGFDYLRGDLPFFMLWATTFSLIGDEHQPAPARWYIKQHLRHSRIARKWGLVLS